MSIGNSLLKRKRKKSKRIKRLQFKIKQENQGSRKDSKVIVVIVESKDTRESIAGQINDKRTVTAATAVTRTIKAITTMEAERKKGKSNVMDVERWDIMLTNGNVTTQPVV
jgi:hypothetical protein